MKNTRRAADLYVWYYQLACRSRENRTNIRSRSHRSAPLHLRPAVNPLVFFYSLLKTAAGWCGRLPALTGNKVRQYQHTGGR